MNHPASYLMSQYATEECPINTGTPWTMGEVEADIEKGLHVSALQVDAMEQLTEEVKEKVN